MFLFFSIKSKEEAIDFSQNLSCQVCGTYGPFKAFVVYKVFSLFFLPVIRWDRKYYLSCSTCGSVYQIDQSLGQDLEAGRKLSLQESDLSLVASSYRPTRTCSSCGYQAEEDFDYCPKCGRKL
ncbi:MAG: zinc ribbon domain-containing protein [Bacillota bacterium]|nr:zinc ribbon domain-containing protein [Bacillota bacterium]